MASLLPYRMDMDMGALQRQQFGNRTSLQQEELRPWPRLSQHTGLGCLPKQHGDLNAFRLAVALKQN